MQYNFLDNSFTVYENVETPKVKFDMPLLNEPLDISDWASGVSENGNPIPKDNIVLEQPRLYINFNSNPEVDINPVDNTTPIVADNPTTVTKSKPTKRMNENIRQQAVNFFMSKGLTNYQAAGIVGNLMAESALKHNIINKSSGAYGLALWLGPRKKELFRRYGSNPSVELQLDFIWDELNTTERSALRHLISTKNLKDATKSFMNMFERPSLKERDESISRRIKYAEESLV